MDGNKRNSSIAMYDYTIPTNLYDLPTLKAKLRTHAKRWVFQTEKGNKTGYEHYQVRLSLKTKKRYTTLKAERKKGIDWLKGSFSPTSNPTYYTGDFFYVMKEDTRIAGPWKDTDEIKVLTQQLKIFLTYALRPFQKDIIKEAIIFELRKINLIWDTTGCCGKSMLSEYMEYIGIAEEIPPFRLMDDIFQWVCSRGIKVGFKKSYIVDMPRGMKKDKLSDFYAGIEVIKNGIAYDKRYQGVKRRFDRPRVFVFTNTLPAFNLMSADKWVIWKIDHDFSYKVIKADEIMQNHENEDDQF